MSKALKPGLILYCLSYVVFAIILIAVSFTVLHGFKLGPTGHAVAPILACNPEKTLCINDCDDNNPDVFPGAEEICDNIDNNCNNIVDEQCRGSKPHDLYILVNSFEDFLNRLK